MMHGQKSIKLSIKCLQKKNSSVAVEKWFVRYWGCSYIRRFVLRFISDGCQVYVLVPCWLPKHGLVTLMAQHKILLNPQPGKVFFLCQGISFIGQNTLHITEIEGVSLYPSLSPTSIVTHWITGGPESPNLILFWSNTFKDGRWICFRVSCCLHRQGRNVWRRRQQFPVKLWRLYHVAIAAASIFTSARNSSVTKG